MTKASNYDKFPCVPVSSASSSCHVGWPAIAGALRELIQGNRPVVCVECYPGVLAKQMDDLAGVLRPASVIRTENLFKSAGCIDQMVAQFLGDDPVFGRMNGLRIEDFFHPAKLAE